MSFAIDYATKTSFKRFVADVAKGFAELDVSRKTHLKSIFAVAKAILWAKNAYERETGTGHGKRNPQRVAPFVEVMAIEVRRSPSTIQNFLNISRLSSDEEKAIIDAGIDAELRFLLELVREPERDKREEAIRIAATEGRAAAKTLLRKSKVTRNGGLTRSEPVRAEPAAANPVVPAGLLNPRQLTVALPRDGSERVVHEPSCVVHLQVLELKPDAVRVKVWLTPPVK